MGGHSKSSSASTQNTTTYNIAADGDNKGVMVGGNNNTITYSDQGAIDAAGKMASQAFQTTQSAIDAVKDSQDNALSFGKYSLNSALDYGEDALKQVTSSNQQALQMMQALQGQQTANSAQQIQALNNLAKSQSTDGGTELLSTVKQIVLILSIVAGGSVVISMWGRK